MGEQRRANNKAEGIMGNQNISWEIKKQNLEKTGAENLGHVLKDTVKPGIALVHVDQLICKKKLEPGPPPLPASLIIVSIVPFLCPPPPLSQPSVDHPSPIIKN